MLDLSPATLGDHEGRSVTVSRVAIKGVGDGLSAAMELDPILAKVGDRVGVYVEGDVIDVHFPRLQDSDDVARTHVIKVDTGVVLDTAEMADLITDVKERKTLADEAAAGVQRFPQVGDEPGDTDGN